MQGVIGDLIELLYPPACIACAKVLHARAFFCEPCDIALERLPPNVCRTCAEPGDFAYGACRRCHASPPSLSSATAPAPE